MHSEKAYILRQFPESRAFVNCFAVLIVLFAGVTVLLLEKYENTNEAEHKVFFADICADYKATGDTL